MEISTEVVSLHDYLTSTSPLPLPALAFRPLTWKQIWLSSEAIVEASEQKLRRCIQLESCRHFFPLFHNPALFPWESQGHIWLSSVAAAVRALKESVCVRVVTAPDRAHVV